MDTVPQLRNNQIHNFTAVTFFVKLAVIHENMYIGEIL